MLHFHGPTADGGGVAVTSTGETSTRGKLVLVAACIGMALLVVLLWGPVALGLHEQSIERWCRWSPSVATAPLDDDRDVQIADCVERALRDPDYLTALRASL